MKKPPFQFGLKAVFIAITGIAAVLTPVIYLSPFDFVIAAATVVAVFLPNAAFYLILCMLVYLCIWLIERRHPPDA
jgi:hypothetical protein